MGIAFGKKSSPTELALETSGKGDGSADKSTPSKPKRAQSETDLKYLLESTRTGKAAENSNSTLDRGSEPAVSPRIQQTQLEAEVCSHMHVEVSSAEGVDTDGNGGNTSDEGEYTDYVGQSIFYVNAAEYQDSSKGDSEEGDASMEDVEYDPLLARLTRYTFDAPVTDVTIHDTNVDGAQSPSLTRVELEDSLKMLKKELEGCVKTIATLQAQIQGGRQPGSGLPRRPTQHEVEVYSYRHAEDSSAEGVDTDEYDGYTSDDGGYAVVDMKDSNYTNVKGQQNSTRCDIKGAHKKEEEAKYGYLQVPMSGHTYEMLYPDDTSRGKGITRAQGPPRTRGSVTIKKKVLQLCKSTQVPPYENLERKLARYVSEWIILDTTELKECLQDITTKQKCKLLKRQDEAGLTPLHKAARRGDGAVVRCLLDAIPPNTQIEILNIQNFNNETALDVAEGEETAQLIQQYRESDQRKSSADQKQDELDKHKESKMAKMEKQLKAEKAKNQDLSEQMEHLNKETKEKDDRMEHLAAQNEEQVNETTDVMADQGEENTEGKQSGYQYEKPLECIDEDKIDSKSGDDEYFAIPVELVHKLKRFGEDHLIQDCRVLQNPYNWKSIALYGTDARKRLESQLNEFLKDNPEFKGYDIEAHDYTEDGQLTQLSFELHCEAGAARLAICELVVQDRNKPGSLLAVGPAHMLFCEELNRHLMTENCNIDRLRKHIEQKRPIRKVKIRSEGVEISVSETPYIAYRYKYKMGDYPPTQQHKLYTNDCALFESALTEEEKRQTEENLMKAHWWNKELHVVSRTQLQHVHFIRQRIAIKNYCGMLYNGIDIEQDIADHKGIHLSFVLTSMDEGGEYRKLEAGDCGSIVYHVGKTPGNPKTLTPWGMLITSQQMPGFVLYRAIVLEQAFTDIKNDYREKLSGLRLYQPSEHGDAAANNAGHSRSKGAVPPKSQYGSR